MATWKPDGLIVKGAQRAFHEKLASIPEIWPNHCKQLSSNTQVEPHAFPGFVPQPREFLNGREIQGLNDFTFNIENNEYELSIAINRKHFEDDQTGTIAERMREMAEVWGTFKDYLFAALMTNGATAGNVAFDGTIFYADTRVIGSSANIDNDHTSAATGGTATVPLASELLAVLPTITSVMRKYQDDQGRPFNRLAAQKIRFVIPPEYESAFRQTLRATTTTTGGENIWAGLAEFDVLDYLAPAAEATDMFVNLVGAERMPFVYQERTPLEVEILDSADSVALHNAVLILCRQRFVFAYGDPRRSMRYVWS